MVAHQRLFGYTTEDLKILLAPMAETGYEPIGSMGTDTPLAVLSERPRLLYDYFQQLFAQVTNPPLDAIREELVTSLASTIGPERNLLAPEPASCNQIVMPRPVLTNEELAKLLYINEDGTQPGWRTFAVDGLFPVRAAEPGRALGEALADVCGKVDDAIEDGAKVIVLSDRHSSPDLAPIPALLLVSAVHHHLIEKKTRTRVGLVVETGEAREVHHMALLLGYGAAAINPYLAFDTITELIGDGVLSGVTPRHAIRNYIKACGKGVLKIMSKMGISTVASYTGAQVFEAIGLSSDVVDAYFTGTVSRIGGIGLDEIAAEVLRPPRPGLPGAAQRAGPPRPGGGRRVPVAARGRVPPLQPDDGAQAAALDPDAALRHLQAVHPGGGRPVGAAGHLAGAVPAAAGRGDGPGPGARSTRSNRCRRSCGASRPAPCPTAPSRRRPTRRWPSP